MPGAEEQLAGHVLGDFTVFDCNWTALDVFLNCTTQFRHTPDGAVYALDYTVLAAVMGMMGIPRKKQPEVFRKVRFIEAGAIPALAKLRDKR